VAPLWKNIFRAANHEAALAKFLEKIPMFSELSERERHYLADFIHVRHYEAGETIFSEGDVGSGLYVIRSGLVRMSVEPVDGGSVELARLEAGDFFGETALCEATTRLATAVAAEACELLGLFRSDLLQLIQNRPALSNKILYGLNQVLSRRIQAMENLHRESLSPVFGEK